MSSTGVNPTAAVRQELLQVVATHQGIKNAELATALRLSGGLHKISGRVVLEAEFHTPYILQRIRKHLYELYQVVGAPKQLPENKAKPDMPRFLMTVVDGDKIARRLGLTDAQKGQTRGLPNRLITGSLDELAAIWRGAFLARGTLTSPGRSGALEILCPTPEVAMALVGAASRLGVVTKSREIRGQVKVQVRDSESISTMLGIMGAPRASRDWNRQQHERETRATANRLVNFDDANLRRSAQASVAACARVERALEILQDDTPEHLRTAGELRLKYREASLDELGSKADPPLTKDAIAGRIRRLLAMADKTAAARGIPGTEANLPG